MISSEVWTEWRETSLEILKILDLETLDQGEDGEEEMLGMSLIRWNNIWTICLIEWETLKEDSLEILRKEITEE